MSFTTTTSAQTGLAGSMLATKAALKASAYTVTRSSDGISFSSSADIITHAGTGAGGINNAGAWFVVAVVAGAPDTQQYLFYRGGSGEWAIWQSAAAGFTGGSPTGLPTAADGVEILQSGIAFIFPDAIWYPGASYTLTVGVENASPWRWYVQTDTPPMGTAAVGAPGSPLVLATGTGFGNVLAQFPDDGAAADAIIDMMSFLATGGGGGGGPSDTTPPVVDNVSPASGSSIARADSVAMKVTDETGLASVEISAVLADGSELTVYDGTDFVGFFGAGSTHTGDEWTIAYDAPGWPSSTVDLKVRALDTSGNLTTETLSYTITDAPAAPTVGPFSPTDGGNTTRTGTITIDVTDDEGRTAISLVTISATLANGTDVAIYNGSAFAQFSGGSSRSNITNGYRYTIVHDSPGWASSTLAFRVIAVDSAGRTTTHTTYNLNVTDAPAAPTISSFSPAAGSISRADNVDFTVTCPDGFSKILVWAVLGDGSTVVVYTGSAFGAQVDSASSVSGTTTKSLSIAFDGDGWTDDYTLHVSATSSLGLTSTASSAYTLSDPPEPAAGDTTSPTVALVSPAEDAEISRTTPIVVDVTDETALAAVFVWVIYPTHAPDLVHDGEAFLDLFSTSTRAGISGGYRYTLRRRGGWPEAPTIRVKPIDTSGNTP